MLLRFGQRIGLVAGPASHSTSGRGRLIGRDDFPWKRQRGESRAG